MSAGIIERYTDADYRADVVRYCCLSHDGWRSTLPGVSGQGFTPDIKRVDETGEEIDIANRSYPELPYQYQKPNLGITGTLTAFLMKLYTEKLPLNDETIKNDGERMIYAGWLNGLIGNPYGIYTGDMDDTWDDIKERVKQHNTLVKPSGKKADSVIICMGALAFCRPDVIKWPSAATMGYDMRNIPGMEEHAAIGAAHLQRVVDITGKATPLQEALLA
jgi:hypothetical protein